MQSISGGNLPGRAFAAAGGVVVADDAAEVDRLGVDGRRPAAGAAGATAVTVAGVTQHRRRATQTDDDGGVQRENDDERRHRVGRQLDKLERAVHEVGGRDARQTRRPPLQRPVRVPL